ncbi:hypothetical protein LUZ60_003883 [Juncus effusus]|nr:hypothetical protein LUZ60_003883 [Juncus effusus]
MRSASVEISKQQETNDDLFKLAKSPILTKLRPFVRTFLKEAQDMFEMYIYTLGMKWYAHELAELIDPEEKYFSSKVISRCDCITQNKKGLDVVLGDDKVIIILDDSESVWQKHRDNLIVMEKYHYFASSMREFGPGKSYSERNEDESESDGALASILNVLKRAHSLFFDPGSGSNFSERDARQVLQSLRKETLHGCKIVFSGFVPLNERAEEQYIWKLAEEMGATCSCEVDSSVTHVVAVERGTKKANWAERNGKYLVTWVWIQAAGYLWKRQREEDFSLPDPEETEKNGKS